MITLYAKQKKRHRCTDVQNTDVQNTNVQMYRCTEHRCTDVQMYKTQIYRTQMYRTGFQTLWEKAGVGCSERTALKQAYYQG